MTTINNDRKETLINKAAQILADKEIGFSNEQIETLKKSYEDLRGKKYHLKKELLYQNY